MIAMPTIPDRTDALRVGRAILEAHGQWEKENAYRGGQEIWGEPHVILLGSAAIAALTDLDARDGNVADKSTAR